MSRDDFASLFDEQDLGKLESEAVWQRMCDAVCQRLAQHPIENWDAQLVGLLWELADKKCKLQVAEILINGSQQSVGRQRCSPNFNEIP